MKAKQSLTVILILFLAQLATAQDRQTSSNYITLEESTKQQIIEIEIVKEVDMLRIGLNTTLYNGIITAEIISPNGELQGKFKAGMEGVLEYDKEGKEKIKEQSRLEKNVDNPETGVWKVKVITQKASGYLRVESKQYTEKKNK